MIRRIEPVRDGTSDARPDYRALVPRADFDVEAAVPSVRPICDDVRDRGVEAIAEYSAKFDGVEQTDIPVPREALTQALAELDPAIRAGPRGVRTPAADPPARPSSSADVVTDLGPGARVTQRLGAGRPGRPLRARRRRPAGLQRADERRPRADRRRRARSRWPRRRRTSAACAPHDPGGLRAARHRGGLRRRRCPGDRDVRLRHRPVPPGRPGDRPRQHLHGHGQAPAQGRGRHRLRGRPHRDRDPRRRHRRRRLRRRRPGQPGRARPDGRLGAGHRLAAPRRRGRGRAGQAGGRDPPRGARPHRPVPACSRASCSSTTSSRASR